MRRLDPVADLLRAAARGGEDADMNEEDALVRLPYYPSKTRPGTRLQRPQ